MLKKKYIFRNNLSHLFLLCFVESREQIRNCRMEFHTNREVIKDLTNVGTRLKFLDGKTTLPIIWQQRHHRHLCAETSSSSQLHSHHRYLPDRTVLDECQIVGSGFF